MMMTCFEQDPQEFGLGEIFSNFKKRLMRGRKKEPFHLLTFMQKDIMQNMSSRDFDKKLLTWRCCL